jgi:hypothetical protein
MSCDELRDACELYALGALEEPEKSAFDEHLATGCATCRARLRQALGTVAALATVVPAIDPPKRLRKRVLAAVGLEKTGWAWISAWATVTAALLVAVLWLSVRDRRQMLELAEARRVGSEIPPLRAQLTSVSQALEFLNQPETRLVLDRKAVPLPPRARVFVNPNRGVLLLADNLPPAPAGKIYEMWVVPKSGAPKPAGLFQSDERGNAVHLLREPVDLASAAAIAVTVEPEGGSSAPTTTPFLVTAL